MSVKIYTAYKVRDASQFWELARDLRTEGRKRVSKAIKKIASEAEVSTETKLFQDTLKWAKTEEKARIQVALKTMFRAYRLSTVSTMRSFYDFNVNVVVRQYEGELYLIPYCDMQLRRVLDFMKKDPRLVDFAYWNNSDQPRGIGSAEWARRGAVWDGMDASGWYETYVVLEISTVDTFWNLVL